MLFRSLRNAHLSTLRTLVGEVTYKLHGLGSDDEREHLRNPSFPIEQLMKGVLIAC